MPSTTTKDGELSKKEMAILGLAWKCFQTEPKIDWEKLAELGGYTNPRSAQNLLYGAKKKLNAEINGGDNADADNNQSVASTPKGKKRKADDEGGNITPRTPKKAKKTKPAPKSAQLAEDKDGEEVVKGEDANIDNADAGI
ncbi:hypothetical protein GGS24DRAFT_501965 [Hypoxylon argillaceum]|nr:hypothetical protein GGS24DRAFT_501965 [Hypoxylon argillaceum]